MRKRVERRLADQEQVHQLAVIRHQRVVAAQRLRPAGPSAVADASASACVESPCRGDRRARRERAIERRTGCSSTLRRSTTGCRPTSANSARIGHDGNADRARGAGARRSGSTPGGSTLSRTALPTIVSRPAVRNTPSAASTAPSHARHRALGGRERHHRHDRRARCRPGRRLRRRHLIGRRGHEPELGGVELGIAGNRRRGLGRRRAFEADVPLTGADASRADRCGLRRPTTRTAICARPGMTPGSRTLTRTSIGAGLAGEERVGAADVRHRQRPPGSSDCGARHQRVIAALAPSSCPTTSRSAPTRTPSASAIGKSDAPGCRRVEPIPARLDRGIDAVGHAVAGEEAVARPRRHQEVGKRPLHGEERRRRTRRRATAREPPVVDGAAASPHHEVERQRRHDEQQREVGRHEAIDLHVDRSEQRLRREQRQHDQHDQRQRRCRPARSWSPASARPTRARALTMKNRKTRGSSPDRSAPGACPSAACTRSRRSRRAASSSPAPQQIQAAEMPAIAGRAVLPGERHQHRAALNGADAGREQHVRRADDLHVEAVGVVPPVVERRRGDHRERAPDADPRAERRAESPEAHGRAASASACRRTSSSARPSRTSARRRCRRDRSPGAPASRTCRGRSSGATRCPRCTPTMTLGDAKRTA